VLAALHLRQPRRPVLSDAEWRAALDYCDRARLTLAMRDALLPDWVRERIAADIAKNEIRLRNLEELYRTIADLLGRAGIEFVGLKGLMHCPLFGTPAELRPQYDIDVFAPRETVHKAQEAMWACGYVPLQCMEEYPTDHLPVLMKRSAWEFRGDYFDPAMPLPIEMHYQFWNASIEKLEAPGVEEFWNRRLTRLVGGVPIGTLCPPDVLGYAALHLIKHLLRGSVRPFHVYEIALCLERQSNDTAFSRDWRNLHSPGLRRLEAVAFRLCREWFGCQVAPQVQEEMDRLPPDTQTWFQEFALSPASSDYSPNKDEIWLHLSLLESRGAAVSVLFRRLLPLQLPPPATTVSPPGKSPNWRRWKMWFGYVGSRVWHHAVSTPRVIASGLRWWRKTNSLGEQFWTFLCAAVLFNFALFIFVLLYNLYLMDLGFREDFLGVVNGAARIGSFAGTLPAAYLAYRVGLKKTLLITIAGTAGITILRALVTARWPLAGLSLVSGAIFSMWAVVMAPVIAGAVAEKKRPAAFSVFFATMFATGIAGNWLGGRLPLWLPSKQAVLLFSGLLSAAALIPALRLRLAPAERAPDARIYPQSRFLWRFLIPFALWHLATGTFNPFNNVYFARLRFPVERIGAIFSGAQFVQVVTVLLAPLVIRRFGLVTGIGWMMAATALGLAGLAAEPPGGAAVLAYTSYMAFQWMSEPGLNTLLMNHVKERERGGASALNYLVAFSAQALAAFAAGSLLTSFGYGPVLAGAAALAVLAAALFQLLLGAPKRSLQENDFAPLRSENS
jgi:MFS family permease